MTVQKQLLGRATYGPRVQLGPGISPLWQFFLGPPAQESIIVYKNGTVVERQSFDIKDIAASGVHTFILGGSDYRTTEGSFEYNALTAAGFTWRDVYTDNVYEETYDSPYNS